MAPSSTNPPTRIVPSRALARSTAPWIAVVVALLVASGCAAVERVGGDGGGLASRSLDPDEVIDRGLDGDGGEAETGEGRLAADESAGSDDTPGVGDGSGTDRSGDVTPAPGSSDPDPALSPNPDIEYAVDTCYVSDPGAAARLVPCGDAHTIEVYAVLALPGGAGAPYQGIDAAFEACGTEFRRITGFGLNLATVLERSVLRPSEETWVDGERDVTCYVVYPEATTRRLGEIDVVRDFERVAIFGLEVGDCLADFDDSATWFPLVGCDQPHEAEVFAAHRFPDGAFPGDEEMNRVSDELCFGSAFEDYVGRDYASSAISALTSLPTIETWGQGDRVLNCLLSDDTERTGSLRGSGR